MLAFILVVAALVLAGVAVWYFGLFGTREAGGIFGAHAREGTAPPPRPAQPACGGVLDMLPPAGDQPVNPVKPRVASGSPLIKYSGSLTGGMLPTGSA